MDQTITVTLDSETIKETIDVIKKLNQELEKARFLLEERKEFTEDSTAYFDWQLEKYLQKEFRELIEDNKEVEYFNFACIFKKKRDLLKEKFKYIIDDISANIYKENKKKATPKSS